jgi:hypothetical protein
MHSYGAIPAAQGLQDLDRKSRGSGKTAVLKMIYLSCNIPKRGDIWIRKVVNLDSVLVKKVLF